MTAVADEAPAESAGPGRYLAAFGLLAACFTVANVTNDVIRAHTHWLFRRLSPDIVQVVDPLPGVIGNLDAEYFLSASKDAAFFFALGALVFFCWPAIRQTVSQVRSAVSWRGAAFGFALSSVLIFQFFMGGYGLIYAKLSLDPFSQPPSYWNQRILMGEIAHLLHLSGAWFFVTYWLVAAAAAALAETYLSARGVALSVLERASLYTVGVFAVALGEPGYPDILVIALGLFALLDFERQGRAGLVQLICFGLALMAHEAAATLVFGALGAFKFGLRATLGYAALVGLYALATLAAYDFSLAKVATAHLVVGGQSAPTAFALHYQRALLSDLVSFKLAVAAPIVAVASWLRGGDYRNAGFVLASFAGAFALTVLDTDYARMASLATIALIVSLGQVAPNLTLVRRRAFAAANLAIPSVWLGAGHGISPFGGLYGLVLRHLFGFERQ